MGKAFEKQIKIIEDRGQKQVDALKDLKPKEQTKPIEDNEIISQKLQLYLMNLLTKEKKYWVNYMIVFTIIIQNLSM